MHTTLGVRQDGVAEPADQRHHRRTEDHPQAKCNNELFSPMKVQAGQIHRLGKERPCLLSIPASVVITGHLGQERSR